MMQNWDDFNCHIADHLGWQIIDPRDSVLEALQKKNKNITFINRIWSAIDFGMQKGCLTSISLNFA